MLAIAEQQDSLAEALQTFMEVVERNRLKTFR